MQESFSVHYRKMLKKYGPLEAAYEALQKPEWAQAMYNDVKISAAGARKLAKMQKLHSKKGVKLK